PLTSRTIRSLSQSTIAQRVVESSPVESDTHYVGPGFVAPIGVGGKFPPEVDFTPQVDLFAIEHQSRDSQRHPGPNQIKGDKDDFYLRTRFNGNPENITFLSQDFSQSWPEAYGIQTDTFYDSSARGVATLPGGVPLFKKLPTPTKPTLSGKINLVGGIGVFFPGDDGFATFEQNFKHGVNQSEKARTNAPKVLEAEFAAVVAAAGSGELVNPSSAFRRNLQEFNRKLPPLKNFVLPTGRIDLVGITLEIFGPNPDRSFRKPGIDRLIAVGRSVGSGDISGELKPVDKNGTLLLPGQPVPEGWLVAPRDSTVSGLTAEAVDEIIAEGVVKAKQTRAAIRLDIDNGFKPGVATGMVLSVADTNGELLGVFRMPDATIFSIDVAVAKARNTAYYADAEDLQDEDRVDFNGDGKFEPVARSIKNPSGDTLPLGTAFTNRTFRFLSEPRYPSGIDIPASAGNRLENSKDLNVCDQDRSLCLKIAPQSILRMPGIHPGTAENLVNDEPLAAAVYQFSPDLNSYGRNTFSVLAFDAFNPSRNFRDPGDPEIVIHGQFDAAGDPVKEPLANQNGVVFFPGSAPLYSSDSERILIGGFGVSGDGVDQDDVVTAAGQVGFEPRAADRVDAYTVAGVRLPYQKFNRNPAL
ncbi:MAG: dockerin type I domain-containing protein, partial [Rubripirellula sp.]